MALPPVAAAVVVLFAAMPTGANAYLFAMRHGRAVNSASGAVALGTMLAIVTTSVIGAGFGGRGGDTPLRISGGQRLVLDVGHGRGHRLRLQRRSDGRLHDTAQILQQAMQRVLGGLKLTFCRRLLQYELRRAYDGSIDHGCHPLPLAFPLQLPWEGASHGALRLRIPGPSTRYRAICNENRHRENHQQGECNNCVHVSAGI